MLTTVLQFSYLLYKSIGETNYLEYPLPTPLDTYTGEPHTRMIFRESFLIVAGSFLE